MKLEKYSKRYLHYYSQELPCFIENIFKEYNIKSVIDLGSGDGSILYALFRKGYLAEGKKVIAVDVSSERISNVKNINNNIQCIVSDACNLEEVSNESLDLAISSQVIEHVSSEKAFIKEVNRVLNKGGLFYLSTVFKKWYGWYFYRCNGHWRLDPTHLREYTSKKQLLNLLNEHNFQVLKDRISLQWFAISDFIFKRIGLGRSIYNNRVAKCIRKIKVPIFGYYNWELVLKKIG